tara:strand:+ start:6757 stop:7515 length:759 start_codon:yes stop_codon:yes gene_type:complete
MNPAAQSIINRVLVGTLLLSLGAVLGVYIGIRRDPVWVPLFNGENLEGWTVRASEADSGKDFWRVANGEIICDSTSNKAERAVWLEHALVIDDFELRLKFKTYSGLQGNSGIQIRSRWEEGSGGKMHGPQIDIHPPAPWRTGLIYDETIGENRWISPSLPDLKIDENQGPSRWVFHFTGDPQPWNELIIRCEGTKITTLVNRMEISDFDGAGVLDNPNHQKYGVGMLGNIALQLHANHELKIHFKDILVRKL